MRFLLSSRCISIILILLISTVPFSESQGLFTLAGDLFRTGRQILRENPQLTRTVIQQGRELMRPRNVAQASRTFVQTGRELRRTLPRNPVSSIITEPWQSLQRGANLNYHPEVRSSTCQLASARGYQCQSYSAVTDDGYVLTVHRIPYGRNGRGRGARPVVFLQHGLLQSSADWVINYASDSFAFILADAGYDVWMGNVRGNTYSRRHTSLSTASNRFWQFSFDEMAQYDLPAMVDTALTQSGQSKLFYVGHSQGSLMGVASFSRYPQWANRVIRAFFAMAPVGSLANTRSPVRLISTYDQQIALATAILGMGELLPSTQLLRILGGGYCSGSTRDACTNLLLLIAGSGGFELNRDRLPVYLGHSPAGTSTQNILHYAQLIKTGRLQSYDYGPAGNRQKYGTARPPQYFPQHVRVPTALFYGYDDVLTVPADVNRLRSQLSNLIGAYPYQGMGHLDFVWGRNAARYVYPQIMQLMRRY